MRARGHPMLSALAHVASKRTGRAQQGSARVKHRDRQDLEDAVRGCVAEQLAPQGATGAAGRSTALRTRHGPKRSGASLCSGLPCAG
jgi:hypothetical protein